MEIKIFDFRDYRAYLNAFLHSLPKRGHGFRAKIAEAVRCEPGYVSRVLSGQAHFSLEQGEALGSLLNQTADEQNFFLLMIQYSRAGTPSLKKFFDSQMEEIVRSRSLIRNRVAAKLSLSAEDQARYFSHWHYATVHVLISLPACQTTEALLRRLKISPRRMGEILDFLLQTNIIFFDNGHYRVGETRIQLSGDSALISKHHANWRQRAIQAIDDEPNKGLHYSSVMTMSQKDMEKIQEIYIRAIEDMNGKVKDSADETAVAFAIDFYEI